MDSVIKYRKKEKLAWSNLKEDRCPKCNTKLCLLAKSESMSCSNRSNGCDFVITLARLGTLKRGMIQSEHDRGWAEEKNFEQLQSM